MANFVAAGQRALRRLVFYCAQSLGSAYMERELVNFYRVSRQICVSSLARASPVNECTLRKVHQPDLCPTRSS